MWHLMFLKNFDFNSNNVSIYEINFRIPQLIMEHVMSVHHKFLFVKIRLRHIPIWVSEILHSNDWRGLHLLASSRLFVTILCNYTRQLLASSRISVTIIWNSTTRPLLGSRQLLASSIISVIILWNSTRQWLGSLTNYWWVV